MAKKIYISPSNQNKNAYASGNTNECEQCNRIADYAAAALKRCGFEVKKAPKGQDMNKSIKDSNTFGANVHLCIHTNAGGGKGTEVFVYKNATENMKYAQPVYDEVSKVTASKVKRYIGRYRYNANGRLAEVDDTSAVAVYVEVEFHDSVNYAKHIIANVKLIGEAIAKGLCKGFGVTYKTESTPSPALKKLDTKGFKHGDNSDGVLAVKRLMLIAKKKGLCPNNVDNNGVFGGGTLVNTNTLLKKWKYAQNGIIGTNFIKRLADEVEKAVKV